MTGFGTNRRETSRIVDTAHPEYNPETSIDATSIPYQMGSNQYASQKVGGSFPIMLILLLLGYDWFWSTSLGSLGPLYLLAKS